MTLALISRIWGTFSRGLNISTVDDLFCGEGVKKGGGRVFVSSSTTQREVENKSSSLPRLAVPPQPSYPRLNALTVPGNLRCPMIRGLPWENKRFFPQTTFSIHFRGSSLRRGPTTGTVDDYPHTGRRGVAVHFDCSLNTSPGPRHSKWTRHRGWEHFRFHSLRENISSCSL